MTTAHPVLLILEISLIVSMEELKGKYVMEKKNWLRYNNIRRF